MIRSFLPSKILILLLAACLMWIGLLSMGFMVFMGKGVAVGWIFAGALALALGVWLGLMLREVRQAFEVRSEDVDEPNQVTSSLPRMAHNMAADGRSWNIGRLNFTRHVRPQARREKHLGRSRVR